MSSARRSVEQQAAYARQATILRQKIFAWDSVLHNSSGENWPTMLGRLNAALNQTANLDRNIDDVMEHFVYVPRKATANPQDIPFFLSTRLETLQNTQEEAEGEEEFVVEGGDPVKHLAEYEANAAKLAAEFKKSMVKY